MANKVNYPKVLRRKITVSSFKNGMKLKSHEKISDISTAKYIRNLDYSTGVLKTGVGSSKFNTFTYSNLSSYKLLAIYPYIRFNHNTNSYEEKIICYCSDKCLYSASVSGGAFTKVSSQTLESAPKVIEYNYLDDDILLLSSSNGLFYLNDNILTKIDGAPDITSLCIHNERIFATVGGEGKSLWFSDDFNPTNWAISIDEAGFIDYFDGNGKLLKVVSFLDYVYVFREYGISRVSASGSQEEFTSVNLFGKQGKIIGSSVTECGDFIVLLTSSGFYTFNGYSTTKILSELDDFLIGCDNSNAKGVFYDNKFYIKMQIALDGTIEDALLSYDIYTGAYQITTGLNILDLAFFGGSVNKLLYIPKSSLNVYKVDDGGAHNNSALLKEWVSPFCDLGISSKNKTLTKVSINTKQKIDLTITADDKVVSFNVDGKGNNAVFPMLKGERFRIKISSKDRIVEIHNLVLYVDYVKEIYDE